MVAVAADPSVAAVRDRMSVIVRLEQALARLARAATWYSRARFGRGLQGEQIAVDGRFDNCIEQR